VAYRIEHSVKAVEEGINDYLSVMTSGRFALGFELDGAKLDVVIYDNGDKVEVNSLSTGQFIKVQLSTLLAIRKVLSAVSSVDVNFLFIDETVSFLDKSSKDTLVEVLLKEPDLNVFIVSHGYTHPLARAMNVVSVDEMSHIEV
jgi:DNA repair exonuclease SbcCD ATPase subunit